MNCEKIKAYYDRGLWSKDRVRKAVEIGIISNEQFKDITGENYS